VTRQIVAVDRCFNSGNCGNELRSHIGWEKPWDEQKRALRDEFLSQSPEIEPV
jgi:hypothetical protein